ncbi:MAG: hypothetical protein ABI969_17275 [bacterium]
MNDLRQDVEGHTDNVLSQFFVVLRVSQREKANAVHLAVTEALMITPPRTPVVFCVYALCILTAVASSANAQVLAPVAIVTSEIARPTNKSLQVEHTTEAGASPVRFLRLPARVALGVAGSFVGLAAGVTTGITFPHRDCHCDGPVYANAVLGGAIGSLAMSALLSSAPSLGSSCSFGKRLASGAVGGTVGALVGTMVGRSGGPNAGAVYGYLGGSAIGSGVGAWLCGK